MQDPVVIIAGRRLINLLANALHLCEIKWGALDWGDLASGDAILCCWNVMVPAYSTQCFWWHLHSQGNAVSWHIDHLLTTSLVCDCTGQNLLFAVSTPLCIFECRPESCQHGLHPLSTIIGSRTDCKLGRICMRQCWLGSPSEVKVLIEYIPAVMPCQVEVGMLSQVDQGCLVCCGFNKHLEDSLPGHDVGDRHLESSWVAL